MDICMSQYWCKKYLQDKRAQGFYQNKSDQDINTGIDFTPLKIKGLASMVETNDLFCTPSEYLMGDKLRPAIYAGSPDGFGTGKETAARKGISMEFTYKTANLYIYPGNVPLTEALPG
ncbi:MAG: hypothetical protein C0397_15950 [Odoribacter sp.]|nr:hypothetical protein [Odoribacter sp.]